MAKRKAKTTYTSYDDDLDSMEAVEDDGISTEIIVDKYMEDISEILSQTYSDIEDKVRELVDALESK